MNFTVNNLELFQTNSTFHSVTTRNKNHFHRPLIANLSSFQKGAHYAGIRIFNSLPPSLKTILDKETFKVASERYLNTCTFYSVDEFLQDEEGSFRGYCTYIVCCIAVDSVTLKYFYAKSLSFVKPH
jgi:hypothetical protein